MILNIKQNLNNKIKFETVSVLSLGGRFDGVPKFFNGGDDHDEDEDDDDGEYYGNVEGQDDFPGSGELQLEKSRLKMDMKIFSRLTLQDKNHETRTDTLPALKMHGHVIRGTRESMDTLFVDDICAHHNCASMIIFTR